MNRFEDSSHLNEKEWDLAWVWLLGSSALLSVWTSSDPGNFYCYSPAPNECVYFMEEKAAGLLPRVNALI